MGKLLGALSLGQIITFLFGTILPYVINMVVPSGDLHNALMDLLPGIMALLMVLLRKPSAEGGAVKTAK